MGRFPQDELVELLFFMGEPRGTVLGEFGATREIAEFGDLVALAGPDTDPPKLFGREAYLHVTEQPSAGAYRTVRFMEWLLQHRPELDYVVRLDDRSFVHVPRLLQLISWHANSSLALGTLAEMPLTIGGLEPDVPCETCALDPAHEKLCAHRAHLVSGGADYRVCLEAAQRCCPGDRDQCGDGLAACASSVLEEGLAAALYFGASRTPYSLHGVAWVLGRRLVDFIGTNANDLKLRGPLDSLVGFWLSAIEDVHFVAVPDGSVHSFTRRQNNVDATEDEGHGSCLEDRLVFAHGLDLDHWATMFDMDSCELRCGVGARS